jgi:hypothetical protein
MKKALISFNVAMWIPRIIFLTIVILSVVLLTIAYANKNIQTWQVESEIIAQRILFAPDGLAYHDPLSNRVYPGIIDVEKLNTTILEESIFYGKENKHIGAKITLINKGTNQTIAETIYNNIVYQRIAERGFLGRGGVDVKEKQFYYVLAKNKEKLTPATAKITVVVPRS